jgi:hypothetical protein
MGGLHIRFINGLRKSHYLKIYIKNDYTNEYIDDCGANRMPGVQILFSVFGLQFHRPW